MRSLKRGTLPVIMLVVVVAWALFAVTMLTGTLVAAQQIDNRVGIINNELGPINEDLDAVVLAVETGRIAGEINTAAQPLTGQFAQIVETGDGIEASAASIAERAKQINVNAKSINSIVGEIGSTVGEINTGAREIDASVDSINVNAESINSHVDDISGSFVGIDGETRSIDDGAAGINNRGDVVIGLSREIKVDTETILPLVVQINENAAAIAGSPLLLRDVALLNQAAAAGALPLADAPDVDAPDVDLPLPNVPGVLPLPDVSELPVPLEGTGLLNSFGSDSGNLNLLGGLG